MKGINLLKIAALSAIGIFATAEGFAQVTYKENIAGNLGGERFGITAPTGIAGIKKINFAPWGKAAMPVISDVEVVKAFDTLGAAALLNGTAPYPDLTGKFALIFRGGGVSFVDKAKRCKDRGAIGCIIVNNIPGSPVGMGAPTGYTETIPVLMVSDVDGMAINNMIKSSPAGTVKATLGSWNLGGTHDLGIVSGYVSTPYALSIPLAQISGASGTVYNDNYAGAAVANYGSATEINVMVTDSVYWMPRSGGRTLVANNSFTIPSIAPLDSIKFGFNSTPYTIAGPTVAGKYEHVYSISYTATDDFPQDNTFTLTQEITDSVYSKVALDPATGNIRPSIWVAPVDASGNPLSALIGAMMYNRTANTTDWKYMQYSLLKSGEDVIGGSTVYTHLLKWVDGVGGDLDSFVQIGELKAIGISARELKSTDSSGDILTVKFLDATDPSDETKKVSLEANTWYVLLAEVPAPYYFGYDQSISTFTRAYGQYVAGGSKPGAAIADRDEVFRSNIDLTTMQADPENVFVNYPYGATATFGSNLFVDSIFYDKYNRTPAISLMSTKHELKLSAATVTKANVGTMEAFPVPASDKVTVTLNLDNMSKKVEIKLIDVVGRTFYSEVRNNVKSDRFDIDVNKLASGNYYILVNTEAGLLRRAITVAK
jgi:hypothetical protein